MKRNLLTLLCMMCSLAASSQSGGFPFGIIAYKDLEMKTYPGDTSAGAVVLNEYGHASINDSQKLIFEYHVKIKIIKPGGQRKGNFQIRLNKNDMDEERWISLQASTFNLREDHSIQVNRFAPDQVFIEKTNKYASIVKFALPEVKVGTVIEVQYVTESPFLFQFHPWHFQEDIPKIHTEYWCKIPGNWIYNITLRGFQKLSKNESDVVGDCFQPSGTSGRSSCLLTKYAMDNVPAFREEKFMTARENFLSTVYFELSELRRFDGTKSVFAEEWKDVDNKLRAHENFGQKIRKA
ncbi:MAG TPA: hypothetical protein VKQ08_00715, partial [Cyclobacteriaceae bacterium]|nr:hypothetical protein [Cyclobacteriaceae bacterium]